MFIDNHSRAGTGVVPVIPNYTETQAGIYGIGKYNYSKGGVEAGVRFDGQETRASGYDWTGNPYGGTRKFNNISYSLGAHHLFPDTGNLPPISGWPGGPPTCMSCTAMGMNSDQECLSEGIRS